MEVTQFQKGIFNIEVRQVTLIKKNSRGGELCRKTTAWHSRCCRRQLGGLVLDTSSFKKKYLGTRIPSKEMMG